MFLIFCSFILMHLSVNTSVQNSLYLQENHRNMTHCQGLLYTYFYVCGTANFLLTASISTELLQSVCCLGHTGAIKLICLHILWGYFVIHFTAQLGILRCLDLLINYAAL